MPTSKRFFNSLKVYYGGECDLSIIIQRQFTRPENRDAGTDATYNVRSALQTLRFAQSWLLIYDLIPSPATASQIRYQVDSAKYLKYAKQTHFGVKE